MRRALLVGIDAYDSAPDLSCCVSDVDALEPLLKRNDDKSLNFTCERLTSAEHGAVGASDLREALHRLFDNPSADVLFYFSGHGVANSVGGHLMMSASDQYDLGFPLHELVRRANLFAERSGRNVLIILDCCYAGLAGNDEEVVGDLDNAAVLQEGLTIIASARPRQESFEIDGHGVFTKLLLLALQGGAADVRGRVSAASIYAYIEGVLGPLDQRPIYKSHAASLDPVRHCDPAVLDHDLRQLTTLFPTPEAQYRLAPSYEETHADAIPEKVEIYQSLKRMQIANLLRCANGPHMYYAALRCETVLLTPTGRFYWELVKTERF